MDVSKFRQYVVVGMFLLTLLNCTTWAQSTKALTLEESLDIARQTNLSIQSTQEQVESAKAQVRAARAGLLPNLSLSGNYTYFKDLPKSVLEASGGFGPPVPPAPGETPPTTGTDESNLIELEFGAHHNFQGTLSLRQPVFAWGRYYYNYQSAKLGLEVAQKELEAAYNQLALDVSEGFYGVLVAQEFVRVAQQTVELVEKQLEVAKQRFEAGAATNFDVLRASVQLANTRSQLIRAQNRVKIAKDAFKNRLNINLNEDVEVQGNLEASVEPFDLEPLIQTAIENRPEIYQLDFSKQAGEKQVDVAKTGNRPDLSFFANYQVDDSERLTKMNRVWNLGFALNFPIFNGFATRAAVQQAESGVKQVQLQKQQLIDAIEFEVRSAYRNLIETQVLIDVQKETVEQAQESVRLANLRYENGMITNVELTDAQIALAQAEVNRLQTLHDYVVGRARLAKAIGQSLGN
jgi:outer membrane protein